MLLTLKSSSDQVYQYDLFFFFYYFLSLIQPNSNLAEYEAQ